MQNALVDVKNMYLNFKGTNQMQIIKRENNFK